MKQGEQHEKNKAMVKYVLICLVLTLLAPMKAQAAEVKASGSCGENLTWTLTTDGVLTISGEGEMEERMPAPWYEYRESVTEVRVESGVMYIGAHAFADCDDLTIVEMPNSVTGIGENAFSNCSELAVVYYPGTAV